MRESAYRITKPISFQYNRSGLGAVQHDLNVGEVIMGQLLGDKVRYRSVVFANGVYYNTPVMIPIAHVEPTTMPDNSPLLTPSEKRDLMVMGFSILFALAITKKL